jgi:hypothetical protein
MHRATTRSSPSSVLMRVRSTDPRQRLAARVRFAGAVGVFAVGVFVLASGCASPSVTPHRRDTSRRTEGGFPLPRGEAPPLGALPALATFAWVLPSDVFTGVNQADDARAMSGSSAELREASSAVLRANGWRETSPDSASYLLALIDVQHAGMRQEMVPDPRGEVIPPSVCADLPREQKQFCREPPLRRYPPIPKMMPYRDHRVAFAIVRVHDQARQSWLVDIAELNVIARGTVMLLTTNAR